jgi:hypothetical protein
VDKRFFNAVASFMGAAVFVGTVTNLLVTVYSSGGDFMNTILYCNIDYGNCGSYFVFWGTIFIAALFCLLALLGNIIWWVNVKRKIYIKARIGSFSDEVSIILVNDNQKELDFGIYPIKLKNLTFSSGPNTLFKEDIETRSFITETSKIRNNRTTIKIAEVYKHEKIKYPVMKYLAGNKGHVIKQYLPLHRTDKDSSDREKNSGDLYGLICEIIFEVHGKIGAGEFSKFYKGKILQYLDVERWERKKYRNKLRWKEKTIPDYSASIQWISLEEYSMTKIKKENTDDKKRQQGSIEPELLTKEDFLKALKKASRPTKPKASRGKGKSKTSE